MPQKAKENNQRIYCNLKRELEMHFGFPKDTEMHTRQFLYSKSPYNIFSWSDAEKQEILARFFTVLYEAELSIINVIISKNKPSDDILNRAVGYSVQRIENDSVRGKDYGWEYEIIADKGRVPQMRKIARAMKKNNEIPSFFSNGTYNKPIKRFLWDIKEGDSQDHPFIQMADLVAYFVRLWYGHFMLKRPIPTPVDKIIAPTDILYVLDALKEYGKLNTKASRGNEYGVVIN